MSRRRHKTEELLLIPFLDILCSLIGVLILIIVVLCVAQSQQTNGRTPEELAMSKEFVELQKQQKQDVSTETLIKERLAALEKLKKELKEKEERSAKLRKLLSTGADIQKMNEELSQNLMKELDNLLLEIEGLTKTQAEMKKEIAALMDELKKLQIPPDKKPPPVMVQPGGSGLAKGAKVFFVEAGGGRIILYWDAKQRTQVSAAAEVIVADAAYNHFLKEVKNVPNSKIIFLMRDDGTGAFNNAAGWAQATYGYQVTQIGKLLLPGRGDVDLQMFKDFLGTLPPPADAKLMPPAGSTPAAPPAAPKPAAAPAPAPATAAPAAAPATAPKPAGT